MEMIALLQEYSDVFAWSYEDMPGLDTNIVVHKIPLEEGCKPVKQKLRRATQIFGSRSRQNSRSSGMLAF
jgi:hypothetical protein